MATLVPVSRYFFDDPAMRGSEQEYAAMRTPIVAGNAQDDLWASPQSRDAFAMDCARALPVAGLFVCRNRVGRAVGG
jgi:predicted alpha/beta hydrolase